MTESLELDGKVALVTGGSKGIGLAVARTLAAAGCFVFITGRGQEDLDNAISSIGDRSRAIRADVANLSDIDEMFATIRREGTQLNVLHINAGSGGFAALADLTPDDFDQTFGLNVRGATFTLQKALPLLTDGASVIITGSSSAHGRTPSFGIYAASKAALRSLTRTWALELAPRGIRVNMVVPGPTGTPGLEALAPTAEAARGMLAGLGGKVPLGGLIDPDDVAQAVLFLASDRSRFTTGSELFVDGGVSHT